MVRELSYPYGSDESGELIHAEDASKGRTYYCPDPKCKSKFILKQRGTGPHSKASHFAHPTDTTCTPDRYLHNTFIRLLSGLLESYRSEAKPLKVNWICNWCLTDYSKNKINFNLLAKTTTIKVEHPLEGCQPDIALLDVEGKVIAAIEIVYTHKPEDNALNYYKSKGITLIQINLSSFEDLFNVEEKITNPDIVNYCVVNRCQNFKNHEVGRRLVVSDIKCKSCGYPKRTFHVESNSVFGAIIPPTYTENELKEAESKGVLYYVQKERMGNRLIIRCLNCEKIKEWKRERNKRARARYGRGRRF